MNNNEYFSTSDFCLATTLLASNFQLIQLDKSNPRRICFLFNRKDEIDKIVPDFHNKLLQVTPQTFYYSQRELKTLMYQEDSYAS